MTDSKIIDKIRKLQNMTVENGASEEEAETAMRMAMGLMARHGIEQSQIKGVEAPKAIRKRIQQDFTRAQQWLASAAAELYGCRVLIYSKGGGLEFVGRPENAEASEMTMFWLMSQMETFYKQALPKGLTKGERAEFRRTFKEACALRILTRSRQMMQDIKNRDAQALASTGSTALVVASHFDTLKKENELVIAELDVKKARAARVKPGSGTIAGDEAGNRVKLRKDIH